MKQIILLIFFLFKLGPADCQIQPDPKIDSMLNQQVKQVSKIDTKTITSMMIFYSNSFWDAKGFLVDNNIQGFKGEKIDSIAECTNGCKARFIAIPLKENLFEIKYKWRDSKDFIVDSFYIYSFRESAYLAYSSKFYNNNLEAIKTSINHWKYGPASTDERDVVLICSMPKNNVVFYFR